MDPTRTIKLHKNKRLFLQNTNQRIHLDTYCRDCSINIIVEAATETSQSFKEESLRWCIFISVYYSLFLSWLADEARQLVMLFV